MSNSSPDLEGMALIDRLWVPAVLKSESGSQVFLSLLFHTKGRYFSRFHLFKSLPVSNPGYAQMREAGWGYYMQVRLAN